MPVDWDNVVPLKPTHLDRKLVSLGGAQTHQLFEDLERLLFRKTIQETYESNLIGEAEPVAGAPTLGDLLHVFPIQGGCAFELLAGQHRRP
jgi:hypothetical protein